MKSNSDNFRINEESANSKEYNSTEYYSLEKKIDKIVVEQRLITSDKIILGLSGGPDSICLLSILSKLSNVHQFKLYPVHINHMLRGNESEDDEHYCREVCENLGLNIQVFRFDVTRISNEKKISIEETARELRYECFRNIAKHLNGALIAVAHNKNDQAETLLMRIARGTGIEGLRGMEFKNGDIIRPLLSTSRNEIEDYCHKNNLMPRIDSTNLKNIYHRNKIRLDLIPYMEEKLQVNVSEALFRLSQNAKADFEYLDYCAKRDYDLCKIEEGKTQIKLDLKSLSKLPYGAINRIIKNSIIKIKGSTKNIEAVHLNNVCDLIINGRTGSIIQLPMGIRVLKSYECVKLYIEHEGNSKSSLETAQLIIPGETFLESGHSFITEIVTKEDYTKCKENDYIQYFDFDALSGGIIIRSRSSGDYIYPYNGNGRKKLKDFFIDSKINQEKRDIIPLLAYKNEIIWIVGLRTSDNFKVTENTNRVLKVLYCKKN